MTDFRAEAEKIQNEPGISFMSKVKKVPKPCEVVSQGHTSWLEDAPLAQNGTF